MKRASLLLVLIMLASMMAACGSLASVGGATTIKIVSSLPRTGSSKGQTDSIVNAIKQRLEEAQYKACDGKITLSYEDLDDATAAAGKWDAAQEASNASR